MKAITLTPQVREALYRRGVLDEEDVDSAHRLVHALATTTDGPLETRADLPLPSDQDSWSAAETIVAAAERLGVEPVPVDGINCGCHPDSPMLSEPHVLIEDDYAGTGWDEVFGGLYRDHEQAERAWPEVVRSATLGGYGVKFVAARFMTRQDLVELKAANDKDEAESSAT